MVSYLIFVISLVYNYKFTNFISSKDVFFNDIDVLFYFFVFWLNITINQNPDFYQ